MYIQCKLFSYLTSVGLAQARPNYYDSSRTDIQLSAISPNHCTKVKFAHTHTHTHTHTQRNLLGNLLLD